MKKITLALTLLFFMCAMGFAEMLEISGSSTLEWGYAGTITDHSASYSGEIPTGDFFTDDSGEHKLGPKTITLTMEAADEMGTVVVKAQSTLDLDDWDVMVDSTKEDAFDFIEFPNVIPGILGIWLGEVDGVSTSVTSKESSTDAPEIVVTLTPVDGLTAKLGLVIDQGELDYVITGSGSSSTTATIVAIPSGTTYTGTGTTYDIDGDLVDDIAIEETTTTGDDTAWAYGTYTDFAASIFAEYELMLGDEDSVTVGVGTVYDTAWGKAVVEDTDGLAAGDILLGLVQEKYLAQTIVAADEAIVEITDTYGYATMPLGLAVDVAMGDLTAGVDFQARLVQGSDEDNLKNDTTMEFKAYEMPMYANLDVGYELAAGDMTITPSLNFKWNNDFWKWGVNDDGDDFEYKGLVSAADYLARPMSAEVGVDVDGIAGMVDLSLSAGLGFGDGNYNHGLAGVPDADGKFAPTLAKLFADQIKAINDLAVADVNDKILVDAPTAMEISVGLTIAPPMLAGLTVTNDFTYSSDGMGFVGADDETLYGDFLSEITNDLVVEYDIMVGDAVGATLFGKLMYDQIVPMMEEGMIYTIDPLTLEQTEQSSKATIGYEIGVKATVSF